MKSEAEIQSDVKRWLEAVVIGLRLCPFAAKPQKEGRVRITVFGGDAEDELLAAMENELQQLASHSPETLETTLIVLPNLLADFYDYNDFIARAERWIAVHGWEGEFQVASFHPDYQFAGTNPSDDENLTNRSPYPMLHLIREESIEEVLTYYPDPENIPKRNIETVRKLGPADKKRLFPYLFGDLR